MPWLHNHVVAVHMAAGAALGSDRYLGLYQLGGNFGESAFYVTPASARMVRGFPIGADVGDAFWLASVEYRLPILRIDQGVLTWPAFVRALSAHVFADAGNAFSPDRWAAPVEDPLLGVGAELRASTILWYGVGATGRLGIATGVLGPNRIPLGDRRFVYFRVGGSF
jgi:outer membrane protein assembly factor BamA